MKKLLRVVIAVIILVFSTSSCTLLDTASYTLENIPPYSGKAWVEINNNQPYFTSKEMITYSFERYEDLDYLGRCGVAYACIGEDIMPKGERGEIGRVKPSGWHTVKYDIVDGKYLYNRCHLIGWQLTGENANEENLITGTRYLNIEGMLDFENMIDDYIEDTGNHVLYRVTPIFEGKNLLASGVQMEGYSVEDNGKGVCFNVYAYNVQPGVEINYANGESCLKGEGSFDTTPTDETEVTYVINKSSRKIHLPDCQSVKDMKPQNKKTYKGSIDELVAKGYTICKSCIDK